MTYSTLADARSYFESPAFEASLADADVERRELDRLAADGEGENILDAVRELAAFATFRRLAVRKLRAHRGRVLGDIQTTAIEYLFGIRRLGPASWGSFENHVNRHHRVGRYRVGRQLKALEDAGIIRTVVEPPHVGTAGVTVELVLAGVKRAPGSAPIVDDDAGVDGERGCELCGSGDVLEHATDPEGRLLTVCAPCAAKVRGHGARPSGREGYALVGQARPEGTGVKVVAIDELDDELDVDEHGQTSLGTAGEQRPLVGLATPAQADDSRVVELELELVRGAGDMSGTEFSVKAERLRKAGGWWPRSLTDWQTPAGRELSARIHEATGYDAELEAECDGHESTAGPIGNVVYCDGSCKTGRRS